MLNHWQSLDSLVVLKVLASYAKEDQSYVARRNSRSSRWHLQVDGKEFEILCTGPKFWDMRANAGGGGAVDLVMHLFGVDFKRAAEILTTRHL